SPDGTRILVAMLGSLLLCICWLRTHGLWLLWGLHFAWAASTGVLFGLPLGGDVSFSSIIDTRASGPAWLPGGYELPIAPPAAHIAMEQAAQTAQPAGPASLVQILPAAPATPGAPSPENPPE